VYEVKFVERNIMHFYAVNNLMAFAVQNRPSPHEMCTILTTVSEIETSKTSSYFHSHDHENSERFTCYGEF
jgi:hypothetical protein